MRDSRNLLINSIPDSYLTACRTILMTCLIFMSFILSYLSLCHMGSIYFLNLCIKDADAAHVRNIAHFYN